MSAVQSTTVYTADGCMIHISDIVHRQHLRSAGCHQLFVPRHRHSIMFGRRAFSVAGPAAWNSLPDYLRDPSRSFDSFRRDLKSFLVLLEALRLCAMTLTLIKQVCRLHDAPNSVDDKLSRMLKITADCVPDSIQTADTTRPFCCVGSAV